MGTLNKVRLFKFNNVILVRELALALDIRTGASVKFGIKGRIENFKK